MARLLIPRCGKLSRISRKVLFFFLMWAGFVFVYYEFFSAELVRATRVEPVAVRLNAAIDDNTIDRLNGRQGNISQNVARTEQLLTSRSVHKRSQVVYIENGERIGANVLQPVKPDEYVANFTYYPQPVFRRKWNSEPPIDITGYNGPSDTTLRHSFDEKQSNLVFSGRIIPDVRDAMYVVACLV